MNVLIYYEKPHIKPKFLIEYKHIIKGYRLIKSIFFIIDIKKRRFLLSFKLCCGQRKLKVHRIYKDFFFY